MKALFVLVLALPMILMAGEVDIVKVEKRSMQAPSEALLRVLEANLEGDYEINDDKEFFSKNLESSYFLIVAFHDNDDGTKRALLLHKVYGNVSGERYAKPKGLLLDATISDSEILNHQVLGYVPLSDHKLSQFLNNVVEFATGGDGIPQGMIASVLSVFGSVALGVHTKSKVARFTSGTEAEKLRIVRSTVGFSEYDRMRGAGPSMGGANTELMASQDYDRFDKKMGKRFSGAAGFLVAGIIAPVVLPAIKALTDGTGALSSKDLLEASEQADLDAGENFEAIVSSVKEAIESAHSHSAREFLRFPGQ